MTKTADDFSPNGFRPIGDAPIQQGEPWGPAVIFPSETGWFAFACWDGAVFVNLVTGAFVYPSCFLLLPASLPSTSPNA
jgi:hypothetical protein